MFKNIQLVHRGDTIKDVYRDGNGDLKVVKQGSIKVRKVEHNACSSFGVHINDLCYDNTATVFVASSEVTDEEVVEAIEEMDFDPGVLV